MSLRTELEQSASYPTRFGWRSDFHLGAPWLKGDRRNFLLDIFDARRRSIQAANPNMSNADLDVLAADKVDEFVDDIIKRVTEKSAGLMQALSILGAVIALLMTNMPPLLAPLADAVLSLTLFTTLLLLINTALFWHRQPRFYTNLHKRLEHGYAVLLERSHRLRLAQWLALICFAAVFGEVVRRSLDAVDAAGGAEVYLRALGTALLTR